MVVCLLWTLFASWWDWFTNFDWLVVVDLVLVLLVDRFVGLIEVSSKVYCLNMVWLVVCWCSFVLLFNCVCFCCLIGGVVYDLWCLYLCLFNCCFVLVCYWFGGYCVVSWLLDCDWLVSYLLSCLLLFCLWFWLIGVCWMLFLFLGYVFAWIVRFICVNYLVLTIGSLLMIVVCLLNWVMFGLVVVCFLIAVFWTFAIVRCLVVWIGGFVLFSCAVRWCLFVMIVCLFIVFC